MGWGHTIHHKDIISQKDEYNSSKPPFHQALGAQEIDQE